MEPRFFKSQSQFRAWLEKNHATAAELLVGFYKVSLGKGGLTYPQALDEALCFGWIDGHRKGRDAETWTIRFTPRKPGSIWSNINVGHMQRLLKAGAVWPAGKKAWEARSAKKTGVYSFENSPRALDAEALAALRANPAALAHWQQRPPSYQRGCAFWLTSAKKPETRARRLATLIDCCARGVPIPPFAY